MRSFAHLLVGIFLAAHALACGAADDTLLIQNLPTGGFRVWHIEGDSNLGEHQLLQLEASATPDGGEVVATARGPARAYETARGIVVDLPQAPSDRQLLLDRDACSALKAWHGEGTTQLTAEQIGDIVVTAAPDGGALVHIGERVAKAFTTRLGVMVTIWSRAQRRKP